VPLGWTRLLPPAPLERLIVLPCVSLSDDVMRGIIRLQLGRIAARVTAMRRIPFTCDDEVDDEVVDLIAGRCTEPESGGRMVDAILTNTMLPDISAMFLNRMLAGTAASRVAVGADAAGFTYDLG